MAIQHELVLLAFFQLGILICVVHDVYQVNLGLIFLLVIAYSLPQVRLDVLYIER